MLFLDAFLLLLLHCPGCVASYVAEHVSGLIYALHGVASYFATKGETLK